MWKNMLINPEDDKHTNLDHLSENEKFELIKKYYDGVKVKDLLKEYNLGISPGKLYSLFPLMVLQNHPCDYCGCPTKTWYGPKGYKDMYIRNAFCPDCGHRPLDKSCDCEKCVEYSKKQEQIKKQKINETYSVRKNIKDVTTLSLQDRVFLVALYNALFDAHTKKITPLKESSEYLAPTVEYANSMIAKLLEDNVISVDPQSPISAFADDNFPHKYKMEEVSYCINVDVAMGNKRELIEQLLPEGYITNNKMKIIELWRDIAIEECIAYLMMELKKFYFDYRPAKETRNIIDGLLVDFSIAQIFTLIWNAKKYAAILCVDKKLTRKHAAYSVPRITMKNAQTAVERNWTIGNSFVLQHNALSNVFLSDCLHIGQKGYTEKISDL